MLAAPLPAAGWQVRLPAGPPDARVASDALDAVIAPDGDVIVIGLVPGVLPDTDVIVARLAGADGTERWRRLFPLAALPLPFTPDDAHFIALDPAGDVVVSAVATGGLIMSPLLAKLDGDTGAIVWRRDGLGRFPTTLAVDASGDILAGSGGPFSVTKYSGATGQPVWTSDPPVPSTYGSVEALALVDGDVIAVGSVLPDDSPTPHLFATRIAGATGLATWAADQAAVGFNSKRFLDIGPDGDVYVASSGDPLSADAARVVRLSPDTGAALWSQTLAPSLSLRGLAAHPVGVAAVFSRLVFGGVRVSLGGVGEQILGRESGAVITERIVDDVGDAAGIAVAPDGDLVVAANPNAPFVLVRLAQADLAETWRLQRSLFVASPGFFFAHRVVPGALGDVVVPGSTSGGFSVLDVRLADGALLACGDFVKDPGESCDDGNLRDGDCCSADCGTATADGTPCDDGTACTVGDRCTGGACYGGANLPCAPCGQCNPIFGCVATSLPECGRGTTTFAASVGIRARRHGGSLRWALRSGPETSRAELGDPRTGSAYALCGYEQGGAVIFRGTAPAGARCGGRACWRQTKRGFRYDDRSARDGLSHLSIAAGPAGAMHAEVEGRGPHLALPSLPIETATAPVFFRLTRDDDTSACWEAELSQVDENGSRRFRARGR